MQSKPTNEDPQFQKIIEFSEEGSDTEGRPYSSLQEMWNYELQFNWYEKSDQYWKKVEPTVNGMLGGFDYISKDDIQGSNEFLNEFLEGKLGFKLGTTQALDCGAGIGRITKELLIRHFQNVDLLEQNSSFLKKAKESINSSRIRNFFCCGLQDFRAGDTIRYDLIWIQWVTGYLSDADLVQFMNQCKQALNQNGIIILKENNSSKGFLVDKEDSSVTRSDKHLRSLLLQSGLTLLKVKLQPRFPKEIFPVRMYALK